MGKLRIRLNPDGTVRMETEGIKGKKCEDYAKVLERLADVKISSVERTEEYYMQDSLELEESERFGNKG